MSDQPFAIGDAMTERGLCRAIMTAWLQGAPMIEEGIALMKSAAGPRPTAEQSGFLARAHRTLAQALPPWRRAARQEALAVAAAYAEQSESLDQLRVMD